MAIIGNVVRGLETVELTPGAAVFADGDNTLFRKGSTELYPDAQEFIDRIDPSALMLVTANPDRYIAADRVDVLRETAPNVPLIGAVHPPKMLWNKANLFREAAEETVLHSGVSNEAQGIVLDDRWLMGVVMGVRSVRQQRPASDVVGFNVRRHDARGDTPLDPPVRRLEHSLFGVIAQHDLLRTLVVGSHPDYPIAPLVRRIQPAQEATEAKEAS